MQQHNNRITQWLVLCVIVLLAILITLVYEIRMTDVIKAYDVREPIKAYKH